MVQAVQITCARLLSIRKIHVTVVLYLLDLHFSWRNYLLLLRLDKARWDQCITIVTVKTQIYPVIKQKDSRTYCRTFEHLIKTEHTDLDSKKNSSTIQLWKSLIESMRKFFFQQELKQIYTVE